MRPRQWDAMMAESDLADEDLGALGAALLPLAELADRAPTPSPELEAVFGERDLDLPRSPRPTALAAGGRGSGMAAGALVLALSCVGATGLSAAANTLPSPFQQQVSEFSRRYLPFDFPQPAARQHQPRRPSQAENRAPSREEVSTGGSEAVATDPRRAEGVSRSLAQPRVAQADQEPSGQRRLRPTEADPRDRASSAPRPTYSEPAEPTSPSQPTTSGSPEPESKPSGPRPSAGVPIKLVGAGPSPGTTRPDKPVLSGGGTTLPGKGPRPPRALVPVKPGAGPVEGPVDGPVDGPSPAPVGGGAPGPDGAPGPGRDEGPGTGATPGGGEASTEGRSSEVD